MPRSYAALVLENGGRSLRLSAAGLGLSCGINDQGYVLPFSLSDIPFLAKLFHLYPLHGAEKTQMLPFMFLLVECDPSFAALYKVPFEDSDCCFTLHVILPHDSST